MMPERLLAKKVTGDGREKIEELYLNSHLLATKSAGVFLSDSVGEKILNSVGLETALWLPRLASVLPLACLFHDLGKSNNWFQKMIRNKLNGRILQPIRHEFLSVIIILRSKKLQSFIQKEIIKFEEDLITPLMNSIYSGILSHHLKIDIDLKKACAGYFGDGGYPTEVIAFTNAVDFDEIFGEFKPVNNFSFTFLENHPDPKYKPIHTWIESFQKINDNWEMFLQKQQDWHLFSTLLKPLVICADVIASALVPQGIQYSDWLLNSLNNYINSTDLKKIVAERLKNKTPREFQKEIADSKERITLVEAGCGSGKTVGAYLWAEKNAAGNKLYFCYPTTGTATEGYLGYVGESEYEAELLHSRSSVDLEGILNSGEENNEIIADKIRALKSYHPKIIICTIDTVLSLLKNERKSLLSFPSISTGIFVFDEIHSFNNEMFFVMVRFIQFFKNTKFLLMSASLQPERKELLKREFGNIQEIKSPSELMNLKRYRFNAIQEHSYLLGDIKKNTGNCKLLVVVNTVRRAQTIYSDLIANGFNSKIYHSRYKYRDRVERHREFINAFQENAGAVVGIATQVSEMSLDIDSDILFTELAPVPSLIQRMGRLNRRTTPENPLKCRDVFFYEPEKTLPYEKDEILQSIKWVDEIFRTGNEISQNDLQKTFLLLNPETTDLYPSVYYDFNKPSMYFTKARDGLRGASTTINCILESDLKEIQNEPESLQNYIIPMTLNQKLDYNNLDLYKHALVIPDDMIQYDKIEGAQWQN